jgi:hypothetical protein
METEPLRDFLPFLPEWLFILAFLVVWICITFLLEVPGCGRGYLGAGICILSLVLFLPLPHIFSLTHSLIPVVAAISWHYRRFGRWWKVPELHGRRSRVY